MISGEADSTEEPVLIFKREEFDEVMQMLLRVEQLCGILHQCEFELRELRMRLTHRLAKFEGLPSTLPPPAERRDTTRYVRAEDGADFLKKQS